MGTHTISQEREGAHLSKARQGLLDTVTSLPGCPPELSPMPRGACPAFEEGGRREGGELQEKPQLLHGRRGHEPADSQAVSLQQEKK